MMERGRRMDRVTSPHMMRFDERDRLVEHLDTELMENHSRHQCSRVSHRLCAITATHPMKQELLHHLNTRMELKLTTGSTLKNVEAGGFVRRRPTDRVDRDVGIDEEPSHCGPPTRSRSNDSLIEAHPSSGSSSVAELKSTNIWSAALRASSSGG